MGSSQDKISSDLAVRLESVQDDDLVDLIIELKPEPPPPASGSRAERIAAQKQKFDDQVASVERLIEQTGGQVLDRAWINQTLRARVKASCIPELAGATEVAAVDLPRQIERE